MLLGFLFGLLRYPSLVCPQPHIVRFSAGAFRLAAALSDFRHDKHHKKLVPYYSETGFDSETWQRALDGLKKFQRLFGPKVQMARHMKEKH